MSLGCSKAFVRVCDDGHVTIALGTRLGIEVAYACFDPAEIDDIIGKLTKAKHVAMLVNAEPKDGGSA
jgi:hypothetical protein